MEKEKPDSAPTHRFETIGEYADAILFGQLDGWKPTDFLKAGGERVDGMQLCIRPPQELGLSRALLSSIGAVAHACTSGDYMLAGNGEAALLSVAKEDFDAAIRPRILERAGVTALSATHHAAVQNSKQAILHHGVCRALFGGGYGAWYHGPGKFGPYQLHVPFRELKAKCGNMPWTRILGHARQMLAETFEVSGVSGYLDMRGEAIFTIPQDQFEEKLLPRLGEAHAGQLASTVSHSFGARLVEQRSSRDITQR
jgi:hypothetical protein